MVNKICFCYTYNFFILLSVLLGRFLLEEWWAGGTLPHNSSLAKTFPVPMRSYIIKKNPFGSAVRDPSVQTDKRILLPLYKN